MSIIIKFVLKSIYEKKFRTFLIVFSIMISSALFFASNAITDTMAKMFSERLKQYTGSADIMIQPNRLSPSSFFYTAKAEAYKDRCEYIVGLMPGSAYYEYKQNEKATFNLQGLFYEDLQLLNPVILDQSYNLEPFTGKKIIISKATAEKYGLHAGDIMDIEINSLLHKFTLCGISNPTGYFMDETQSAYAIVPRETLASLYNARGRVNTIYIKLKNPADKGQMIGELSGEYNKYTVREPFSQEEFKREVGQLVTMFMMMLIIVAFMSIFIIYTSFKVITAERLPVIGTFRSIGATRKMTDAVLLAESLLYSLIGGALGFAAGLVILYMMSMAMTPQYMKGFRATIEFAPWHVAGTFIFAVVLCFVSSILPIVKISKIPVKEIVLNAIEKSTKKKRWQPVLGILFLAAAFTVPNFTSGKAAVPINIACMVLTTVSVTLLIPYITIALVKIFESVYSLTFGNEGVLAAKNLRENKSVLNNITLLAIGISSILMITTISNSVSEQVLNVYKNVSKFDLQMFIGRADRNLEQMLYRVEGVQDVYGAFEMYQVEYTDRNDKIMMLSGIDKTKHIDFWNVDMERDSTAAFEELDAARNILITNTLKEKFGLKMGDTMNLKLGKDVRSYKVIGFYNTLWNNGNCALISQRFFKLDTGSQFYSRFYIKASKDPEEVSQALQKEFMRRRPSIRTTLEMEKMNMQGNAQLFAILQGFSILAMVIGIIGVFNNLIISFIARKRSLAMFRSIGMSKRQIIKMIFIESMTGGLIGGFSGVLSCILTVLILPYVFKAIDLPKIPLHLAADSMLVSIAVGAVITLIASISPAMKSSKMNIIDAIKYE